MVGKWPKIKTWRARCYDGRWDSGHLTTNQDIKNVMQEEIDELRKALTHARRAAAKNAV